jgi:hypothetical protein
MPAEQQGSRIGVGVFCLSYYLQQDALYLSLSPIHPHHHSTHTMSSQSSHTTHLPL